MPDAATGDGGIGFGEAEAMELVVREHAEEDEMANDRDVAFREAEDVEALGCRGGCLIPGPNTVPIPRGLRGSPKRIGMRFFACVSCLLILFRRVAGAVI
jgi:hypothetical protein